MLIGIVRRIDVFGTRGQVAGRLNFLQEAPKKWLLWKKN